MVVVGRTTFSRDILGRAVLPAAQQPGDLLAFDDAGAYCQSMASLFLGQPDPADSFLGQAELILGQPRDRSWLRRGVPRPLGGDRPETMHETAEFAGQA